MVDETNLHVTRYVCVYKVGRKGICGYDEGSQFRLKEIADEILVWKNKSRYNHFQLEL